MLFISSWFGPDVLCLFVPRYDKYYQTPRVWLTGYDEVCYSNFSYPCSLCMLDNWSSKDLVHWYSFCIVTGYQSPLPDPAKVGALYTRYDLYHDYLCWDLTMVLEEH